MKYDVHFCSCGRIHIMPESELGWLQEDYKHREVIRVCINCGDTTTTWLDDYEDGYAINCQPIETFISKPNEVNNAHMYADRGIIVYMMSGGMAEGYVAGTYVDNRAWEEENKKRFISVDEAKAEKLPWVTVDTERLIRDIKRCYKDDADDILKSISGYFSGINWAGTEYANK